jgi:hypothetical protein
MAILPPLVSRPTRHPPVAIVLSFALMAGGCAEPIPGPDPAMESSPPAAEAESEFETPPAETPTTASPATDPNPRPTARHSPDSVAPAAAPPQPGATPDNAGLPGQAGPSTPTGTGNTERVTADVGVGQRGRSLDKYEGAVERTIVEPARTLFAVRERMVFSTQIPQALQLYKATHGQGPATEQQFFQEIIQANNIRLPELPAGQRYLYDPASEELLVERPAR